MNTGLLKVIFGKLNNLANKNDAQILGIISALVIHANLFTGFLAIAALTILHSASFLLESKVKKSGVIIASTFSWKMFFLGYLAKFIAYAMLGAIAYLAPYVFTKPDIAEIFQSLIVNFLFISEAQGIMVHLASFIPSLVPLKDSLDNFKKSDEKQDNQSNITIDPPNSSMPTI